MTKQELVRIARLARLELTDAEMVSFAGQISAILNSFEALEQVDTVGVEPLVTPVDIVPYLRDDKVAECPTQVEDLLRNAPDQSGRLFKVPPVV